MSLEKPWERPFNKLLEQMRTQWGGQFTTELRASAREPAGKGAPIYGVYPTYEGEMDNQRFSVTIREFPSFGADVLGAQDNVEYLRLWVMQKLDSHVFIRHETLLDRLSKRLRLAREYQTYNEEFNKTYFLEMRTDTDKQLLEMIHVQQLINQLEPFSEIAIIPTGVHWSQEVRRGSQLELSAVQARLRVMLELANLVDRAA